MKVLVPMQAWFVIVMLGLLDVRVEAEKKGKDKQSDKCGGWDCEPSKKMKAKYASREGSKGAFCDIPVFEAGKLPADLKKDPEWRFKPFIIRKGTTLLSGGFTKDNLMKNGDMEGMPARYGHSWTIVRQNGMAKEEVALGEFLSSLMHEKRYDGNQMMERPFLFHDFSPVFGVKGTQFSIPSLIKGWNAKSNLTFSPRTSTPVLLIGAGLSGVGFHRHSATLQMMAHGYKRWLLYPPERSPPGGDTGGWPIYDWMDKVYTKLEGEKKPIECIQKKDDLIWVPELWFHATLNLGDTVAVSIQHGDGESEGFFLQRSWSMLNIGDPKADEFTTAIMKLQPNNIGARVDYAMELHAQGKIAQAEKELHTVIKDDPLFINAMVILAEILEYRLKTATNKKATAKAEKELQDTLETWIPSLELNERNFASHRLLSRYYELAGNRQKYEFHERRLDFLDESGITEANIFNAEPAHGNPHAQQEL